MTRGGIPLHLKVHKIVVIAEIELMIGTVDNAMAYTVGVERIGGIWR